MKHILATLIILLMPVILFALPALPDSPEVLRTEAGPYVKAEISLIQTELGSEKLGDLNVGAWTGLRDRLSIAAQKDEYVRAMAAESYFLPGLGQFHEGDTASGMGFLALDVGIIAGTLVVAYYLLPSDLRFDRLDYFRDSARTVNNAWGSHSFVDYLPAISALLGGAVLDQTVRHWASDHARRGAVDAVDQGRVQFTPRIGVGFMGFDIRY